MTRKEELEAARDVIDKELIEISAQETASAGLSLEQLRSLEKFEKKLLNEPIGKQRTLRFMYEGDEEWTVESY